MSPVHKYAVLIDGYTEGLRYVQTQDPAKPNDRNAMIPHEVETISEALVLAADNSYGSAWEIVERIDVRTTPGSMADQLGLA